MKIALVCPYSLDVPGGVQGQVLGLAAALRAAGHDARVLAPAASAAPAAGVVALGRSTGVPANGSVAPLALGPTAQRRAARALREGRFDVIHVHEPLAPGIAHTVLAQRAAPLLGTFHAAGESAGYRILGPVARRLAARLDLRAAVSEAAAELASRHLGGAYEILWNGIDVEAFSSAEPWPTAGPTVLFLGRHEPRKGLAVLLRAASGLPSSTRFWIAGEGPQTAELRATHGGDARIEWLGRIDDAERARRLRGADVVCSPALGGESFGMVLLETMAAGTPLVASDIPGFRTVATDEQDALLVPPGDADALALALVRVLAEPELRSALVAAGSARAAELSMATLAARYVELYASIAARG